MHRVPPDRKIGADEIRILIPNKGVDLCARELALAQNLAKLVVGTLIVIIFVITTGIAERGCCCLQSQGVACCGAERSTTTSLGSSRYIDLGIVRIIRIHWIVLVLALGLRSCRVGLARPSDVDGQLIANDRTQRLAILALDVLREDIDARKALLAQVRVQF